MFSVMGRISIIFGFIILFSACGRNITNTKSDQYYILNKAIFNSKYDIGDNDLIVHAHTIKLKRETSFNFSNTALKGIVYIKCKKVKGKRIYSITGLKAEAIEQRFKIILE